MTDAYRSLIVRQLDSGSTTIEGYDDLGDTTHRSIAVRLQQRRKPFDANGAGYGGALIWEHVRRAAARFRRVAFITNNIDDFCESKASSTLHTDLRADLDDRDSVGVYRTVQEYVEHRFGSEDLDLRDTASRILLELLDDPNTKGQILLRFEHQLLDAEIISSDGTFSATVDTAGVHWIDVTNVHAARTVGIPDFWVIVDFDLYCDLELEGGENIGHDWTTSSTRRVVLPGVVGTCTLNLNSRELDDFAIDTSGLDIRSIFEMSA